jgi:hypothetical protein
MKMVELNKLENGNLQIELTDAELLFDYFDQDKRPSVFDILEDSRYIGNGWSDETDNVSGFLTSSPIIAEGADHNEEGFCVDAENFWYFDNYMIEDEWETLLNEGSVIFTKAD